ncbi:hypothetical protein [Terrihabitans sp. B22-R8]|uniref:hypothetical protein n=1 Tax=Terrihabitans sp. B22-R8 TaxID=3425128 RepID=UPI00403D0924
MARTSDILAGLAVGIAVGVGASFAISPGPAVANGGYEAGTETIRSNKPAKGDLLVTQEPVRVARNLLAQPVEVRQVQVLGDQSASIVLLDDKGRIVYRSSPAEARTSVAKNVEVPSVAPASTDNLSLRIDTAFRAIPRES